MSAVDDEDIAPRPAKRIQQLHPATTSRSPQVLKTTLAAPNRESLAIRPSGPSTTILTTTPTTTFSSSIVSDVIAPKSSPHTFQFVNVTKASGTQDKAAQRLVRSYATKRHWQHRRMENVALAKRNDPNFVPASFDSVMKGRCTCLFSQVVDTTTPGHPPNSPQVRRRSRISLELPTSSDNVPSSSTLSLVSASSTQLLCRFCGRATLSSNFATPPISIMRVGNSDPFNSFPIETQPHMHELIDHYGSVLGPMLLPVDSSGTLNPLRNVWIAKAMSDPAMFHATLCVAALHLALLKPDTLLRLVQRPSGGPKAPIFAIHREESIKLINEKLATEDASSDVNIGALLTIASCETFTGNLVDYQKNATVLQELVKRRGGLQNLGLDSLLHQMCQWVDNCGSAMTNTKPRFEYVRVDTHRIPVITELPDSPPPSLHTGGGIDIFKNTAVFQEEMWGIYTDLLSLTNELNWTHNNPMSQTNMFSFSDRRASVEYRLTSISATDGILKPADDHRYIQESSRVAALLFVNRVLRAMPNNAAMIQQLLYLLKRCLQRTNLDQKWGRYSELLLWALFLGGTATTTMADRIWFVTQVINLTTALDLRSWADVHRILQRYLYPEHVLEKLCIMFWEEIEKALA